MNGLRLRATMIFLFTAMILVARPALVFGSSSIRTALVEHSNGYGLIKAVRKRKERIPVIDILRDEDRRFLQTGLAAVLLPVRKFLFRVLAMMALAYSGVYVVKRRRTVFEVRACNNHFLSLSMLRV